MIHISEIRRTLCATTGHCSYAAQTGICPTGLPVRLDAQTRAGNQFLFRPTSSTAQIAVVAANSFSRSLPSRPILGACFPQLEMPRGFISSFPFSFRIASFAVNSGKRQLTLPCKELGLRHFFRFGRIRNVLSGGNIEYDLGQKFRVAWLVRQLFGMWIDSYFF